MHSKQRLLDGDGAWCRVVTQQTSELSSLQDVIVSQASPYPRGVFASWATHVLRHDHASFSVVTITIIIIQRTLFGGGHQSNQAPCNSLTALTGSSRGRRYHIVHVTTDAGHQHQMINPIVHHHPPMTFPVVRTDCTCRKHLLLLLCLLDLFVITCHSVLSLWLLLCLLDVEILVIVAVVEVMVVFTPNIAPLASTYYQDLTTFRPRSQGLAAT